MMLEKTQDHIMQSTSHSTKDSMTKALTSFSSLSSLKSSKISDLKPSYYRVALTVSQATDSAVSTFQSKVTAQLLLSSKNSTFRLSFSEVEGTL